ncbi:hypothetical protein EJ05DRAFT_445150 [Pseudovirgaria hyperparasitica]|uniref:pH-response regulator protein palC n=1 Tax=Pseudovirgaria hyperparasitica TaxID=470096 RepID=A0A6A6VRC3_9PEZI|nr:uncharacterized protein EJ05DRAFT_445150 [Pseudovirgaria hyperparasitica]KAF2753228.1 hypothetical protein EJ05DRAFT_445150 [Pseudovirgaria hyperparasitica]
MPYPFQLPTTSATPLSQSLTSYTHPSLPLTATTHRHSLRQCLKSWKRTPPAQQQSQLPQLIQAITAYLPYLFALDAGLSGKAVAGEELDVVLVSEVIVEWKPVLSKTERESARAGRVRLKSLESELAFTLLTLALAHILAARTHLRVLLADTPDSFSLTTRSAQHAKALRSMLDAHSILTYLLPRTQSAPTPPVADISPSAISALQSLTLADATLLFVAKDDPYPAALAEARSKSSTEWMYKAPSLGKVRAGLFARCCLEAAAHASRAHSLFSAASTSTGGGTGRSIDELGLGIAWLRGAKTELGLAVAGSEDADADTGAKRSGLAKLKSSWKESREAKKVQTHTAWGADGGRAEEALILDDLERKWMKTNDTIGVQTIPGYAALLAGMPSGRDPLREMLRPWKVPVLDAEEVARMRAPPESGDRVEEGESSGDDDSVVPGAFPEGVGAYY